MLLFLCEVVEAQAVDLAGSETTDSSDGRFGIGDRNYSPASRFLRRFA